MVKERPSQKAKVTHWTTWSWNHNQTWSQQQSQNQSDQKGHKGKTGKDKFICQVCGISGHQAQQCWRQPGGILSNKELRKESTTISELNASLQYLRGSSGSTIQDQPTQILEETTRSTSRISRSKTSCSSSAKRTKSSIMSVWVNVFCSSSPWPGSGFSGHRLNINHLAQPFSSEVDVKEVGSSLPYPIGPSLPSYLQEP